MKRNFEVFFFKSRQSSVVYIQELDNTSTFTQVEQDTAADWCLTTKNLKLASVKALREWSKIQQPIDVLMFNNKEPSASL